MMLAFGGPQSVVAQDEEDTFMLEEITVTAQKRAENQQKVAIAMEVVSGEELTALGKTDISEILNSVSSVMIQSSTDGLRVSIRGISNDNSPFRNIQASTPTVAVNTDGVYTNRNSGNTSLYDVDRVEVLFGPQSTMYASGSPGGIVNVVTADPKTDQYSASGAIEYGNYDLLHTEGSLNVPVNDAVAFRAAFYTSVRDGYLSNGSNDEDKKSGRLKALYQPNENFSMVLTGEVTKSAGQGFASVAAFEDQDDEDDPWTSDSENAGMGREENSEKITARIDYDFGYAGSLSVIPSYSETTNSSAGTQTMTMGPSSTTYYSVVAGEGWEKGLEARMTSSEDFPFKWILGANIYKTKDDQSQVNENQDDENAELEYQDQWNEQETKAVYANVTYPVSDTLRATVGARQSWDENTTWNYEKPGKGGVGETLEGSTMEYDSPNFKLGAEYDLAVNSMLYADIASSYRMNGSGVTQDGVLLDPEELVAYSFGAKNRFMDNRLQVNAAVYYYDYKNYFANMAPSRVPYDSDGDGVWDGTEEQVNIETGDAVVYGLDVQTSAILSDKDRLSLNISYVKKYFTDLVFDFPDVVNNLGIDDLDYEDEDMPQAPNWKVNANYTHNFILPNGGSLTAGVEASYTSKYVLNWMAKSLSTELDDYGNYTATVEDTSDVRWQEAYILADLSLVYSDPEGKWSVTGYVKNVTDYAVKQFLDGMGNLMIGDPMTYGATLSMRF
jgi:iron complex outermembrane receptor protein